MYHSQQFTHDVTVYIREMHNSETTFAELRSIISFLTELVSRKERRSLVDEMERKRFLKTTQGVLVRIAMEALIQIQFISLFLNVGRQLEPHHFKSLFPLSLSDATINSDHIISLQDLFDMAVNDGSFSVPGAALPLFTNKRIVHSLCVNLLHHCITTILGFSDTNCLDIKSLREECLSVNQLFSYIIKVEDSERLLQSPMSNSYDSSESSVQSSQYHFDESLANEDLTSSEEFSFVDSVAGTSYDNHANKQNMKKSGRFSALASRLIRPLISSKETQNENAISDAANSFIMSNYEKSTQNTSELQESESFLSDSASDSSISTDDYRDVTAYFENDDLAALSASGVVAMSIASTIFFVNDPTAETIPRALRNIAALCLLLRKDNESSSSMPSLNSSAMMDLINGLNVDDFLDSMLNLENLLGNEEPFDAQETVFMTTDLMEMLLLHGENEWSIERAEAVGEVLVTILARHENSPEIVTLSPLLSMILVTAYHVAKQSMPFENLDRNQCALAELYHAALE